MGRAPSHSTKLTHNAALNAVFDEAVARNFLTAANRPTLAATGRKSDRRPAFDLDEVRKLLAALEGWIARGRTAKSREARTVMRDYVEMLLDTGARPGVELLNLRWRQIKLRRDLINTPTGEISPEDGEPIEISNLQRTVEMTVSGKTGARQIIGRLPTVKVLARIAKRNYNLTNATVINPFDGVARPDNDDFVLRGKDQADVGSSFQKMLERFLKEHGLLLDPATQQHRVFYSFRHTYATLALTHDRVPIHTLAQQMGTSVLMIERHYSHLNVLNAIEQLRGNESRRLIASTHPIT
jgi:integrase